MWISQLSAEISTKGLAEPRGVRGNQSQKLKSFLQQLSYTKHLPERSLCSEDENASYVGEPAPTVHYKLLTSHMKGQGHGRRSLNALIIDHEEGGIISYLSS